MYVARKRIQVENRVQMMVGCRIAGDKEEEPVIGLMTSTSITGVIIGWKLNTRTYYSRY